MAFLVLVIDLPNHTIGSINDRVNFGATKPHECVVGAENYLSAILAGAADASVQYTSRDTDPSVSTSGSGSAQATCNLK